MHRGYTKRWRKRWEKGYHKDPLLWVIMDYFIDHANHKDTIVYLPNVGKVEIKRGQHLFSDRQLAKLLSVKRQRIRTRIKSLKSTHFLTTKSTHRYTIATILNYDTYQPLKEEEKPTEQPTEQPTPNPELTRPNNDNNDNNKKYSVGFEDFWKEYPNKISKKKSFEIWKKLSKTNQLPSVDVILESIEKQKVWRKNSNGEFRPAWKHPTTWLNQGCWEDECEVENKQKPIELRETPTPDFLKDFMVGKEMK